MKNLRPIFHYVFWACFYSISGFSLGHYYAEAQDEPSEEKVHAHQVCACQQNLDEPVLPSDMNLNGKSQSLQQLQEKVKHVKRTYVKPEVVAKEFISFSSAYTQGEEPHVKIAEDLSKESMQSIVNVLTGTEDSSWMRSAKWTNGVDIQHGLRQEYQDDHCMSVGIWNTSATIQCRDLIDRHAKEFAESHLVLLQKIIDIVLPGYTVRIRAIQGGHIVNSVEYSIHPSK